MYTKQSFFWGLILALILGNGCQTGKNTAGHSANKSLAPSFQTLLDSAVTDKMPGILLHVESPDLGVSWSGAAGMSDVQNKVPLKPGQTFRIASVTKTFVACAILRLWEEGRLSLDDPISRYVSAAHNDLLKKGGYEPDQIRLRHLLTHSSGVFDYSHTDQFFARILREPEHHWTPTEQLAGAMEWGKPQGAPGERFHYSDTGYVLLAEAIEKITGKDYGTAMAGLLAFRKLGIRSSALETAVTGADAAKRIHQYWQEGTDTYHYSPTVDLYGGGGLLCSSTDLAVFYQNLFNHNVFRRTATLDTMLRKVEFPAGKRPGMDYRMGIFATTINGMEAFTHSGFWGTQVVYIPQLNTSIATNYSQYWSSRGNAPVISKAAAIIQSRISSPKAASNR